MDRRARDRSAGDHPLLLLHGAWQGAWAWDALMPHLRDAGMQAAAIDFPGGGRDATPDAHISLDAYVARSAEAIREVGAPAILVAHSGAGVVASQCAEAHPDMVAGIVYLAGMMLPSGMAYAELAASLAAAHPEVAGIGPHLRWNDDRSRSWVPEAAAVQIFYHDAPLEAALAAARRLTWQEESARAVRPRLTPERFGRVPRLYIEALRDRSLPIVVQRRMQALVPGARVKSMDTGHALQLADPKGLAALLARHLRGA